MDIRLDAGFHQLVQPFCLGQIDLGAILIEQRLVGDPKADSIEPPVSNPANIVNGLYNGMDGIVSVISQHKTGKAGQGVQRFAASLSRLCQRLVAQSGACRLGAVHGHIAFDPIARPQALDGSLGFFHGEHVIHAHALQLFIKLKDLLAADRIDMPYIPKPGGGKFIIPCMVGHGNGDVLVDIGTDQLQEVPCFPHAAIGIGQIAAEAVAIIVVGSDAYGGIVGHSHSVATGDGEIHILDLAVYQGSVFDTMSLYIKSPKTP